MLTLFGHFILRTFMAVAKIFSKMLVLCVMNFQILKLLCNFENV